MEPLVLALETLKPDDLLRVGGKAAQLGRLLAAGFPVPSGLCLPTTAFQVALAPHRDAISRLLSRSDLTDRVVAQSASAEIAVILENWSVPPVVMEALNAALVSCPETSHLAVRSSATAEDRADVSFAGQYETVLGVPNRSALPDAILTCWRSFFSPHALVARATAQAVDDDEAMALLIQDMVDAECSGVAFSVDPVRTDSGLLVVNAAWGLGTGVVDSQAASDTYRVRRSDLRADERQIAEKPERVGLSPKGGLALESVPEDRQRAACLPEKWLQRIAQFTVAAENLLGGPQDVEWAIAEDRVWILQSRPVTALPFDFSLGAHFPLAEEDRTGPLWEISGNSRRRVPLSLDLDIDAVRTAASTETMIHNGGSWGDRRDLTLRKIVNGRVYTRSVPSDLLAGDARIRKNAAQGLSHRLRETNVTPWEHYAPEVIAATQRLSEFDLDTGDGPALAEHLEDALGAYRRHWMLHFALPNGQAFSEPFMEAFAKLTGRTKEEAREAAFPLLEGAGNMLTQLVDGLYALACAARDTSVVALLVGEEPDVMKRLETLPDAGPFREALDGFLNVYGDRSGLGVEGQPALHIPTWREQPELIFPMVASYLNESVEAPETLRVRMNRERDRQAEALCQDSDDEDMAAAFRRWLPLMRRARTDLENHNHYIDQMSVGQLRAAILAAGQWMSDRNLLAERDDVFWLNLDEITRELRTDPPVSFTETVAHRKAELETRNLMAPPPLLGLPERQLEPRPPLKEEVKAEEVSEDGVLRGVGASAGRVRGRARVVPSGTQYPDIAPGEILVAEYAGPAWTPLFPTLGGIVLNHAALFHHAATTAREYGLPAVINVKDATSRIPDRAWLTIDGATGEILLESEEASDLPESSG